MDETEERSPVKVEPQDDETTQATTQYTVHVEWVSLAAEDAMTIHKEPSNDVKLPSNVCSFEQLSDLVVNDAENAVPYGFLGRMRFFAYNKHDHLVALCNDERLKSWIQDLAERSHERPPAALWVAKKYDCWAADTQATVYMNGIEKFTRQRKLEGMT